MFLVPQVTGQMTGSSLPSVQTLALLGVPVSCRPPASPPPPLSAWVPQSLRMMKAHDGRPGRGGRDQGRQAWDELEEELVGGFLPHLAAAPAKAPGERTPHCTVLFCNSNVKGGACGRAGGGAGGGLRPPPWLQPVARVAVEDTPTVLYCFVTIM